MKIIFDLTYDAKERLNAILPEYAKDFIQAVCEECKFDLLMDILDEVYPCNHPVYNGVPDEQEIRRFFENNLYLLAEEMGIEKYLDNEEEEEDGE